MANDTKFTHISVTIDDDDDFVIEAGAPAAAPVEPEPAESAGVAAASAAPAAEPAAAPAAVAAVSAVEPAVAAAPAPVVASAAPAAAQKPASQGYRETTLDDLEGEKMSGMQKGVIAAAFVAIIVFIVYLVL